MRKFTLFSILVLLFAGMAFTTSAQDDGEGDQEFDLPLTESIEFAFRNGDTLDALGALFDVQVECILETNDLAPTDTLTPGQLLLIDVACPRYDGPSAVAFPRTGASGMEEPLAVDDPPVDTSQQADDTDEDDPGDGDDMDDMEQSDDTDDMMDEDTDDTAASPTPPVPGTQEIPVTTESISYTVQYGDTLDTIGQAFNVSVVAIVVENGIENPDLIFPGDELFVPAGVPVYGFYPALESIDRGGFTGDVYVAQPFDTLDEVGQLYNVSVVSLLVANELQYGRDLQPGDALVIPADAPPYGQFPALDSDEREEILEGVAGDIYVMQPQETVDGISARFNVAPRCVLEANQIGNPRFLTPGTSLVIPADCPAYDGYDVVPQS